MQSLHAPTVCSVLLFGKMPLMPISPYRARRVKIGRAIDEGLDARMASLRTLTPYQKRARRAGHDKIFAALGERSRLECTALEPPTCVPIKTNRAAAR